jgi:hypothetical protein
MAVYIRYKHGMHSLPRLIESLSFYSLHWNAGNLEDSNFKLSSGGAKVYGFYFVC